LHIRSPFEAIAAHELLAETVDKNWHATRIFLLTKNAWSRIVAVRTSTMSDSLPPEITQLLMAWRNGDQTALKQLMPLVYRELHRLAHHLMNRERPGCVLQTTALVNEAYLRLVDSSQVQWKSRAHFFAVAAQLMRRVLVDAARERQSRKRGGDWVQVSLADVVIPQQRRADLLALDDALEALAAMDKRKSEIVVMRFFGGLTVEETAAVLEVSPDTVMRDWQLAKVWLYRQLGKDLNEA
jgi:RNA polymerase sigma factor (TIGR02999 family)